jgi:uncharacterized protein YggE
MRVMPWIILLVALLVAPVASWGSDAMRPEIPTLTVTGTGTMTAPPDAAFVTVGVETVGKSLTEAQRQNSAVMQKVMERLLQLKIEKERIQTASFTVAPQYKPPPKHPVDAPPAPPEIIGYTVGNMVTVEVRELEKVAMVIDETLAAGANHFHGLQWTLRNEQQARLNALKIAAAKAREKAVGLSEAINVRLVRLMNVTEGVHFVRPTAQFGRAMMATNGGGGDTPISPGEMRVEATVTLSYEIGKE